MLTKSINFSVEKTQALMIAGFAKRFNSYSDSDFYNAAMDFIKPRKFLLHNITYDKLHWKG